MNTDTIALLVFFKNMSYYFRMIMRMKNVNNFQMAKVQPLSNITFTSEIKNILTFYWSTHDNILLMGNLDMTLDNPNFNQLIEDHELTALISEPTCFKNINPTSIESLLTSKKTRFMNTLAFETGLSDHHKFIGAMLRSTFSKGKPKKNILPLLQKL